MWSSYRPFFYGFGPASDRSPQNSTHVGVSAQSSDLHIHLRAELYVPQQPASQEHSNERDFDHPLFKNENPSDKKQRRSERKSSHLSS